ncbi:MAG: deoxyguanosinetriphosphate triphosphohydrolase [Candidatus Aminicenantes bacterium]|nr:deoxyguanosinetriphosphate triphosphohydrolase [Candidatus Aminicenantes bacterium]
MLIRELLERNEEKLDPRAARSINSRKRRREKKSPVRTEFQRDRDRILHSKSFRRLKHKTQVFIAPEGDHFRTRLTHTLEVSQIARTIARALNLNEDLTEAIALGHDIGHTPFGHIGEKVLDELSENGFKHNEQSLRVVDKLEYNGKGLNLTFAVRNGILTHSKGMGPFFPQDSSLIPVTLEGQIVRISDSIAYVNHDIDDAIRAGIITEKDIPDSTKKKLGKTFAKRIDTMVIDVINMSMKNNLESIIMSRDIHDEIILLRQFLYKRVYWRKETEQNHQKIRNILFTILNTLKKEPGKFINPYPERDSIERRITDFIAGMTDRYALTLFEEITLPTYIY